MRPINKAILAAAVGLGFAQAASAAVSCSCEHQGSATDGICEAQPSQDYMSTLYTYNLYLMGGLPSHEVPRYQYTWAPVGGARLVGNAKRFSEMASYTCTFPQSCTLKVKVHQYADGSMISGMNGSGYPTFIGEATCWHGTVGGE